MLLRGVPMPFPPPGSRVSRPSPEAHEPRAETNEHSGGAAPPTHLPSSQQPPSSAVSLWTRWTALGQGRPCYTDSLPPDPEAVERVDRWFRHAQHPGFDFPVRSDPRSTPKPRQQHGSGQEQLEPEPVDTTPLPGLVWCNLKPLAGSNGLPAQTAANIAYACQHAVHDVVEGRRFVVDGDIYTGLTGGGEHVAHAVLAVDIAVLLHLAVLSDKGKVMMQPLDVLTSLLTAACGVSLADPDAVATPVRSLDDAGRMQGYAARFIPFAFSSHVSLGGGEIYCSGLGDVDFGAEASQAAAGRWIKQGCLTADGALDPFAEQLDVLAWLDEAFKAQVGGLLASGRSEEDAVEQALRGLRSSSAPT